MVVNAGRPGTWPDASHRLVRAIARELAAAVQYTSAPGGIGLEIVRSV